MTVLRWETPPPKGDTMLRSWATLVAVDLAARPGEWAVVGEYQQPIDVSEPMARLYDEPNVWCTHRTERGLTTLYACWATREPGSR